MAILQTAVLIHGGALVRTTPQAHVWTPWNPRGAEGEGGSFRGLTRLQHKRRLDAREVVHHAISFDREHGTCRIDGMLVTDLETTILHAARFLPIDEAFVAVDSLMAIATQRPDHWREDPSELIDRSTRIAGALVDRLKEIPGQRGVKQARSVLAHASPLSESPSESNVRRIALGLGYWQAESQLKVSTDLGIKWGDVGIRSARVIWEPNGGIKYEGEAGKVRRAAEDVRRLAIQRAGYTVVDLTTAESWDSALLARSFRTLASTTRRGRIPPLLTKQEVSGLS